MSEEALQTAEQRREAKSKGEREGYTQLNAEFQKITRRDKKAFFNEQCKEIEENNRKAKTRDLSKKIRSIKRTFHPKTGTVKDRNSKDLIEAEEIKQRQKKYTEEPYKEDFNDPDSHNGVIIHPEPDILEYEVKWALESTAVSKASAGDEIPAELFKILKADAIKVLHSIYQQTRQEKSILIPVPKKGSTTGCANHRTDSCTYLPR